MQKTKLGNVHQTARTWCSKFQCLTQLNLTDFQVRRLCVSTNVARKYYVQCTYRCRRSVSRPRCREEDHLASRLSFEVAQTHDQWQAVFTKRSKADVEWLGGLGQWLHVANHFNILPMTLQHL